MATNLVGQWGTALLGSGPERYQAEFNVRQNVRSTFDETGGHCLRFPAQYAFARGLTV
jgi:hypothetical protein